MPDTTYRVVLDLSTRGELGAKLGEIGGHAGSAQGHIERLGHATHIVGEAIESMGHKLGDLLEGVADKAIEVGTHLGKLAGLAALGVATYGVAHLNNELEQTQIALGAISQAQGFARTFEEGFAMAGDQLAKMKQDVKTLPGDLGQLSDIMKMVATPAAQGGASLDAIRQLAGKTMLVGTILGVPLEVASREMAGLLSGRAGSHNILGGRLGLLGEEAQKFNKLAPEERLARINVELAKYSGAADRFGQSFVANWTTLKDNIKYGMLAEATAPLFERVKHGIAEINTYFDTHQHQIQEIANTVGNRLVEAWDAVEDRVKRVSVVVGPLLDRLIHMQPGEMLGHLEHAGAAVLATKVAGMGLSGAGSLVGSIFGATRLAGILGPALGGLGGVGGAAGGVGASLGAAAGVAAPAVAVLGTALVATAGAADILTDKMSFYHDDAVKKVDDIGKHFEHMGELIHPSTEALHKFVDLMGDALLLAADELTKQLDFLVTGMMNAANATHEWLIKMGILAPHMAADIPGPIKEQATDIGLRLIKMAPNEAFGSEAAHKVKPKDVHLHVNEIKIEVKGSDDPSRVARLTVEQLREWSRNPTRSKFVPNYAGASHL